MWGAAFSVLADGKPQQRACIDDEGRLFLAIVSVGHGSVGAADGRERGGS